MSDQDRMDQLNGAVESMASIATPEIPVDILAGMLVGTLPDHDPETKLYMLSVAFAAALKKLWGVRNRPPTPTEERENDE